MNLFKQQQTTSGYNTIPDTIADDETAAVPLGTTVLSPTTTTVIMGHRLSKRMIAIVFGMTIMLVAGGAVWMRPDGGSSYDHSSGSLNTAAEDGSGLATAAEGLVVVATEASSAICFPATGTFSGVSFFSPDGDESRYFETCFQLKGYSAYCWTQSGNYHQCIPDGLIGNDAWHHIDPKYMNPVTHPYSCGEPCHNVQALYTKDKGRCHPATGTFGGYSVTITCKSDPFETCWQLHELSTYCWTRSYYMWENPNSDAFAPSNFRCAPNGEAWHPISAEYVNPVTHPNSCGLPCQVVHELH